MKPLLVFGLVLTTAILLPYSTAFQCFDDDRNAITCDSDVNYCVKDQIQLGKVNRFCSGQGQVTCNREGCVGNGDSHFCCCSSNLCNTATNTQKNTLLFTFAAVFTAFTVLLVR